MYIAALRIADDFGCDAVGIQYQQGLKDLVPASRPGRGTAQQRRPPAGAQPRRRARAVRRARRCRTSTRSTRASAVDALVTNRVWTAMGLDPATTLHDIRWGEDVRRPSSSGCSRSPARCRPRTSSAATTRAVQRAAAADVLPARRRHAQRGLQARARSSGRGVFIDGRRAARRPRPRPRASSCPRRRPQRRLDATTPQWPIMHAVLHGVEPRPVHGPAQGQPPQRGLRARRRDAPTGRWPPRPRCSPRSA